jgi:hypothetical protein
MKKKTAQRKSSQRKSSQDFTKYYKKLSNKNMHIWLNLDEILARKGENIQLKIDARKFVEKYPDLS